MEDGAVAETKVAGVFVQHYGKDRVAPEIAVGGVDIVGAEALGVAFHALSVAGVTILSLTDAGGDSCEGKDVDVGRAFVHQVHFLAWSKRGYSALVDRVEGWNDAEDTLFFLFLQLFLAEARVALEVGSDRAPLGFLLTGRCWGRCRRGRGWGCRWGGLGRRGCLRRFLTGNINGGIDRSELIRLIEIRNGNRQRSVRQRIRCLRDRLGA